ncbi:MAG: beta-propeller fold lactonase family protein, partial [Acidobacteria bacterium]|nr:beta-propeller fold lactonase family protein [Acidobacteriota bacterium]
MNPTYRTILIASVAVTAGLLVSQPAPPERVGPAPDGSFLLNSGARLQPAGRQIPLSTFPMASALSPNGKHLVILQGGYMPPSVSLHDPVTLSEVHRLTLPDAWLGLVFAPAGNVFYVGGGSRSAVYEVAISTENKLELRREFMVVPQDKRKHTDFIGDVTMSPDGRLIYAAALFHDSVIVINPQSGMVIEEWKTGHRPYRILFHPDGKSYFVSGWGDSSVHQHNANNGDTLARYAVGTQPMDMVWRGTPTKNEEGAEDLTYKARLFITAAGTNTVVVFGVSDGGALRRLETINVELYPKKQPVGMTPAALALSPDQDTLYVVCSDANALARVDVRTDRSAVQGFIPTGWYPTAARVLAGGQLMVLNGRGQASFPNPLGPNPTIRRAPVHEGIIAVQYVGAIQSGSASLIPPPSAEELDAHTKAVLRNSPYRRQEAAPAMIPAGNPLVRAEGKPPAIEHVIYIVKENRTYDHVLGDLGIGNG